MADPKRAVITNVAHWIADGPKRTAMIQVTVAFPEADLGSTDGAYSVVWQAYMKIGDALKDDKEHLSILKPRDEGEKSIKMIVEVINSQLAKERGEAEHG